MTKMKVILLAHKQNNEVKNMMKVNIHLRTDNQSGDFAFLFSFSFSIFGGQSTVYIVSSASVSFVVDVDAVIVSFFFGENDGSIIVSPVAVSIFDIV